MVLEKTFQSPLGCKNTRKKPLAEPPDGAPEQSAGDGNAMVDQGALRRFLAQMLPYYMVPAFWQELPALPLNDNGKLDRRALPPIQAATGGYAPPESETEKLLCEAFARVLDTSMPVGIDDSFFAMGGDSVRAMAVAALIRERGLDMKMAWLFAAPTVRELSPMLPALSAFTQDPRGVSQQRDAQDKALLRQDHSLAQNMPRDGMRSPDHGGGSETDAALWSAELSAPEWETVDRAAGRSNVEAVYPILPGMRDYCRRDDPCRICSAFLMDRDFTLEDLRLRLAGSVRCHQALRTVIVGRDTDRPLQVVLKEWTIPAFFVDLSSLASSGSLELSDAQVKYLQGLQGLYQAKPFSGTEVMFDAGLVKVSERHSVLVLAVSHLLLDATGSIRIREELAGGAPAVSDVRQYNRYMRRLLSAEYAEESRRVWQKIFAQRQGFSSLPPAPGEGGSRVKLFVAGEAFAKKAAGFCARTRVTSAALVCVALGRVLMELCGSQEAGFFVTTNGRDADNVRLTGMFTSILPVWVAKEDTPVRLQEQLVRALSAPLPDLEVLDEAGEGVIPKHGVFLSMQNHLHTQKLQDLFHSTAFAAQRTGGALADGAPSRTRISVHVVPAPLFRITLLYNGAWYDSALAARLGRGLLAQLRLLVETGVRTE